MAFTLYNKYDAKGSLVGNWQEERVLQDYTGTHHRLPPNNKTLRKEGGTLEDSLAAAAPMDSYLRTIEHTERQVRHTKMIYP
jgi:hypothetical protein